MPSGKTTKTITTKERLRQNLFSKLDEMYVLMNVKENLARLKNCDNRAYYLKLKTELDVKQYIWNCVETTITTAHQKGYTNGYKKGLVEGALAAKGAEEAEYDRQI